MPKHFFVTSLTFLLKLTENLTAAQLISPFCEALSDESIKFGEQQIAHTMLNSYSDEQFTENFQHNMRPTAFQCCQNSDGHVHGLKMRFETMQNHGSLEEVPYFVADVPKSVESSCIGPNCDEGCHEFVDVHAFPWNTSPITALIFSKDQETGHLSQVSVRVQGDYQICDVTEPSKNFEHIEVSYPIVGFQYTQTDTAITSLQLAMNSCSMHSKAAFDLDFGDEVPDGPIMLQIQDLAYRKQNKDDFSMIIDLPISPKMFIEAEYNHSLDARCRYDLKATVLTNEVPDYVRVDKDLNQLVISEKASGWPEEPRHDILSLECQIGGVFKFSRTIEIIFYKLWIDMTQEEEDQCYKFVNYGDPFQLPLEKFSYFRTAYRDYGKLASFQCCWSTDSQKMDIRVSRDGSGKEFEEGVQCHNSEPVRISDYEIYGIMGGSNAAKDFVLVNETKQKYFSACGKRYDRLPTKMPEKEFESYSHLKDGYFIDFKIYPSFLALIGNRCQVTPEFIKYKKPIVLTYDDYGDDLEEIEEIEIDLSSFNLGFSNSIELVNFYFKPQLQKTMRKTPIITSGWQPYESLSEIRLQKKNIADLKLFDFGQYYGYFWEDYDDSFSQQIYEQLYFKSILVEFNINFLLQILVRNKTSFTAIETELKYPDKLYQLEYDNEDLIQDKDNEDEEAIRSTDLDIDFLCELQVDYPVQIRDYHIQDKMNQLIFDTNPVYCSKTNIPYHVDNFVFAKLSDSGMIVEDGELIYQLSESKFAFETYKQKYLDLTVTLIQVSNLYALNEHTGLETMLETFVQNLAHIKIKSRCQELIIEPLDLHVMKVEVGTDKVKTQMFRPLQDIYSLLTEGHCGSVQHSLTSQRPDRAWLLDKIVTVDGNLITLNASHTSEEHIGHYTLQLSFDLIDYNQRYSFPLKIILGLKEATTDEEIRKAINIAPGFDRFEPGVQDELPGVTLEVNRPYLYELPAIMEWNEDDSVEISIEIGDAILSTCNCVTLQGSEAIQFDLPPSYIGESSTIAIKLNDGLKESAYYLKVEGVPFVPDFVPEPPLEPLRVERGVEIQQILMAGVLKAEEVDIETEELSKRAYDKCIPSFARINRDGEVTIKFDRRLVITQDINDLEEKIVSSGSIQVQVVDEGWPYAQPNKNYTWSIRIGEEMDEIHIKVMFEDPSAISSTSNSLDKLRITFVDTSEIIRCETRQERKKVREEQAQTIAASESNKSTRTLADGDIYYEGYIMINPKHDLIPQNYVMVVELAQQMTEKQSEQREEIIKEVEAPTKTFYFSSIAIATMNNLSLQTIWGSINALQIIAHIPLNSVNFPANCFHLFQFLAEVVSFDLFAPTDYFDFGFTETRPQNQRFDDLGYETTNLYENMGSIGLIAVLMACRMIVVPIILWMLSFLNLCRCCRRVQKFLSINGSYCTNTWIRFGIHTYFELIICSLVGLRLSSVIFQENKTWQDDVAIKSSYVLTALCALFFLFVGFMTLIYIRGYVSYKKNEEEMRLAKSQQEVVTQNQKFQEMLDYGPNLFFKSNDQNSLPIRRTNSNYNSVVNEAGQAELKIPLPPRNNQVLVFRPDNLGEQAEPRFGFHAYVSELYRDLKPYKLSAMPIYFYHSMRRITFVLVAIYMSDQPFLQILLYLAQSILMVCFLASKRPFNDPMTCRMELFNEFVVLCVGYHMVVLMSSDNLNSHRMSQIGISLISVIIGLCFVNSAKFIFENIRVAILHLRRCRAQIIGQKRQKAYKKKYIRESKIIERITTAQTENSLTVDHGRLSDCNISDSQSATKLNQAFNELNACTPKAKPGDLSITTVRVQRLNTELDELNQTSRVDTDAFLLTKGDARKRHTSLKFHEDSRLIREEEDVEEASELGRRLMMLENGQDDILEQNKTLREEPSPQLYIANPNDVSVYFDIKSVQSSPVGQTPYLMRPSNQSSLQSSPVGGRGNGDNQSLLIRQSEQSSLKIVEEFKVRAVRDQMGSFENRMNDAVQNIRILPEENTPEERDVSIESLQIKHSVVDIEAVKGHILHKLNDGALNNSISHEGSFQEIRRTAASKYEQTCLSRQSSQNFVQVSDNSRLINLHNHVNATAISRLTGFTAALKTTSTDQSRFTVKRPQPLPEEIELQPESILKDDMLKQENSNLEGHSSNANISTLGSNHENSMTEANTVPESTRPIRKPQQCITPEFQGEDSITDVAAAQNYNDDSIVQFYHVTRVGAEASSNRQIESRNSLQTCSVFGSIDVNTMIEQVKPSQALRKPQQVSATAATSQINNISGDSQQFDLPQNIAVQELNAMSCPLRPDFESSIQQVQDASFRHRLGEQSSVFQDSTRLIVNANETEASPARRPQPARKNIKELLRKSNGKENR